MFFKKRKVQPTIPVKVGDSLLTCPDDEFVDRFDALWESFKDENGIIHMQVGLITTDRLYG